jgi:hypothetical protein
MAHGPHRRQGVSIRIAILVEGETERVFLPKLREFLQPRLEGKMPRLDSVPHDGRIPTGEKLKRVVERLLDDRQRPADAVIALTDVYTGTPEFSTAEDAKNKMHAWVGNEPRFHPHVALHDFEAWLLPFWTDIQRLADSNRASPGPCPEKVNHGNPPAHRIKDVFLHGRRRTAYVKPRDAQRILRGKDLMDSAQACPELKAFLNTILSLCGGNLL